MPETTEPLTLKKIIGAMLFAARKPLQPAEIKQLLADTAENEDEAVGRQFAKVKESEILAGIEQIKVDLIQQANGIRIIEVAGGFRLQTDPECSPWLRQLLNSGRPSRLSKPTLETLAIIAYRQPATRAEIEAVRGVNVDAIVRHLMDCQLIKITGRSSLPGHPLLYGTTQLFLEHFGLQSIDHLPGIEQLRRKEEERMRAARQPAAASEPAGDSPEEPAAPEQQDAAQAETPQPITEKES